MYSCELAQFDSRWQNPVRRAGFDIVTRLVLGIWLGLKSSSKQSVHVGTSSYFLSYPSMAPGVTGVMTSQEALAFFCMHIMAQLRDEMERVSGSWTGTRVRFMKRDACQVHETERVSGSWTRTRVRFMKRDACQVHEMERVSVHETERVSGS